jgi:hypothetical protein
MDAGGTGAPEVDSDSDNSDQINVPITVEILPSGHRVVGEWPNIIHVPIHTLVIQTSTAQITLESAGYTEVTAELLLTIAQELASAARSRVRNGTLQVTRR